MITTEEILMVLVTISQVRGGKKSHKISFSNSLNFPLLFFSLRLMLILNDQRFFGMQIPPSATGDR